MRRNFSDTTVGCFAIFWLAALVWGAAAGGFWIVLIALAIWVLLFEVWETYRIQHQVAHRHLLAAALLILLLSWMFLYDYVKFNRMKPSQHLQAAKDALVGMRFSDVERNLAAVPASPESDQLRKQLQAAQETELQAATERKQQEESQAQIKRAADEQGRLYAEWLQRDLTETGYDVKVSWSGVPAMITMASRDFENTELRVKFLAHLRKQLSVWPCKVRLTGAGLLGESFIGIYDMDCLADK
jgi:hypothetical protein